MNGVLTEQECRHLTEQEYTHYFELGLCAPPTVELIEGFRAIDREDLERAIEQRDEANDTVNELAMEVRDLNRELIEARVRITDLEKELEALRARTAAQASESDPAKGPAESPVPGV